MFSSTTFLSRFREYHQRLGLMGKGDRIVVAVSGGIDSVTLLDLLVKEGRGSLLVIAHFNHQLRGSESEADQQHVAALAQKYGIPFHIERADTAARAKERGMGIQECARDLRYEFFENLLMSAHADCIATAHNADDNAETILLNLFRGAGVSGLAGIPVRREGEKIIRPLLFATRDEIEDYAREERLAFRNDSSNEHDDYTRNFLRHRVLPLVKEHVNPAAIQVLNRSAELFREMHAYLADTARRGFEQIAAGASENDIALSITRLREYPLLVQQYIVILAVTRATGRAPESDHVNAILNLSTAITGSRLNLPGGAVAYRDRDELVLRIGESTGTFRITVRPNRRYTVGRFSFSTEVLPWIGGSPDGAGGVEYVDADRVGTGDLTLRSWTNGDSFVPLGMTGRKKVSDFFIDAGIPAFEKHRYPILATEAGEIIWLCGRRIDDRFKVTDATRRVLKLEFLSLTFGANE